MNIAKWDEVNLAVNARWLAKTKQQEEIIKQLSATAPPTSTSTAPPNPAVEKAPADAPTVTRPPMQPMVALPVATLPETQAEVITLPSVLTGLQLLKEQDLDVRAAYPVRWHMIWDQGLEASALGSLLPVELVGKDGPDPMGVIPQRTLGALRRQLDKLAMQWEVKFASNTIQAETQAGATALYERVMDEAKRVVARKRAAPAAASNEQPEDL